MCERGAFFEGASANGGDGGREDELAEGYAEHEGAFADGGKGCSAGEVDFEEVVTAHKSTRANGRQVGGEDDLTKRCVGESVATNVTDASEKGELAEGALTESLLSNGGKCRGEGEDVGEVRAAHERLRREINEVVREAEVRASNQIIYGLSLIHI